MRNWGLKKSKLDKQELLDNKWIRQQDEKLEKNKAENIVATIQHSCNTSIFMIPLDFATPNKQ